jgi:hypothetical protein
MGDIESMTIEQHEAEISRLSDSILPIRAQMLLHHDAMERKIKATPIVATGKDQVIGLGGADIVSQLKALPPALFEQAKAFFKGGN